MLFDAVEKPGRAPLVYTAVCQGRGSSQLLVGQLTGHAVASILKRYARTVRQSGMSAAVALRKRLDLPAMMISWRLGVDYLEELDMDSLPGEQALRCLVRQDFHVPLEQLFRLRQELA
jgi:hypothetical protein